MGEPKKQQPVFTKVDQLRPMATGLNLTVKVVNTKMIVPRGNQGRQMRLAECLVGDETGMIIFTARNDQGIVFGFSFVFLVSIQHAVSISERRESHCVVRTFSRGSRWWQIRGCILICYDIRLRSIMITRV